MFTILFKTSSFVPDLQVTLRTSADGFQRDLPGAYTDEQWRFDLPVPHGPGGLRFKFMLERTYWMLGDDLFLEPREGATYEYAETEVAFEAMTEAIVENANFQQTFFKPNLDEQHVYDVLVIGSGIGGGIIADQLADSGADVLILEAGSLLFSTHTGNLPRRHRPGQFDKHLWNLFERYRVTNYRNGEGTSFEGGQAFNLGGRSIFWGGLIPRMTWWELEHWPQSIRFHLEDTGYQRAEDLMYWPMPPSPFQTLVRRRLMPSVLPEFDHFDAPMAVRDSVPGAGTLSAGLFSTADLLTESRLTEGPAGNSELTINLNHAVVELASQDSAITEVVAYDRLARCYRRYRARYVVLAAGTIESAKLALSSRLRSASGLVGHGITDHPIFYAHFGIPAGSRYHARDSSCKILSRHQRASQHEHSYNLVLELGADLNQGRYVDRDIQQQHEQGKMNTMLGEVVFLFDAPLVSDNRLEHTGPAHAKPLLHMTACPVPDGYVAEMEDCREKIFRALDAETLPNEPPGLRRASIGGAGHEVGTLRLGPPAASVVDENLKWHEYDNLYVCDLSVFPRSPAANPTLTLAALALRLASHLTLKLQSPSLA